MPDFNMEQLRTDARRGTWSWNQQTVDTIVAYLFSRGWRYPKTRTLPTRVVHESSNDRDPNCISVSRVRLKDPGGPSYKGVDKALKQALRLERQTNLIKELVLDVRTALFKNEMDKAHDLLNQIYLMVGGRDGSN